VGNWGEISRLEGRKREASAPPRAGTTKDMELRVENLLRNKKGFEKGGFEKKRRLRPEPRV